MKSGSDNFRYSAIIEIMKKIYERGIEIIIFEPNYEGETFKEFMIIKDPSFDKASNIILANRIDENLKI